MPTTPKGITYPSNSSPVAVPADIQQAAEDVDGMIVPSTGGTYTGSVSFTQSPSVPTPTSGLHAVNKTYADAINADVTALETELGTNPSGTFSTVVQRLDSYTDGFNKVGNLLTDDQANVVGGGWYGNVGTSDTTTDGGITVGRFTVTGANGNRDAFNLLAPVPFDAGVTRTATISIKPSATRTVRLVADGWDAGWSNRDNIGTVDVSCPAGVWTDISITATTTAARSYVGLVATVLSAQTGDVILAKRASVHKGAGGKWSLPGVPVPGQGAIKANGAVELPGGDYSPEGVVTANPGSTFLQTSGAATVTGMLSWRKATGTGNTGWVAGAEADTGWRIVTAWDSAGTITAGSIPGTALAPRSGNAGDIKVRRIGDRVIMRICNLGFLSTNLVNSTANKIWTWATGWRVGSTLSIPATLLGSPGTVEVVAVRLSMGDTAVEFDYPQTITATTQYMTAEFSWLTDDAWPTSLPGSAA